MLRFLKSPLVWFYFFIFWLVAGSIDFYKMMNGTDTTFWLCIDFVWGAISVAMFFMEREAKD
jgi:hypothetical protein